MTLQLALAPSPLQSEQSLRAVNCQVVAAFQFGNKESGSEEENVGVTNTRMAELFPRR